MTYLHLEYALSRLADGDINGRFHGDAGVLEGFARDATSIHDFCEMLIAHINTQLPELRDR